MHSIFILYMNVQVKTVYKFNVTDYRHKAFFQMGNRSLKLALLLCISFLTTKRSLYNSILLFWSHYYDCSSLLLFLVHYSSLAYFFIYILQVNINRTLNNISNCIQRINIAKKVLLLFNSRVTLTFSTAQQKSASRRRRLQTLA